MFSGRYTYRYVVGLVHTTAAHSQRRLTRVTGKVM
jgi:hypothetical protein